MRKQKGGFLTFICSLVPGAGELYMGFKKQGTSIMLMFWGILALVSVTGFAWIAMLLPVLWAYSFFQVHNLRTMPQEIFDLQRDEYAFRLGYVLEHKRELLKKYRIVIAVLLIVIGASALLDVFGSVLYHLVPYYMVDTLYTVGHVARNLIVAGIFIGGGAYLAMNKEKWQDFID